MSNLGLVNHKINVIFSEEEYALAQQLRLTPDNLSKLFQVSHSLLSAIQIGETGHLFLMLGENHHSRQQSVFLSLVLASIVDPWNEVVIATKIEPGQESWFLCLIAYHIFASIILKDLKNREHVLIARAHCCSCLNFGGCSRCSQLLDTVLQ